jgi:metallophosphoesterase superfamily enzyme
LKERPAVSPEHKIVLGGVELRPHESGALHVPEFSTLIISDLHLEQGSSLARRGIRVPPYDTAITINLLEQVVKRFAPQRLIFLGDSFHDAEGETRVEDHLLSRLQALSSGHECFWICGNHDPLPPQLLAGHAADHILLGPLTLRHEPKTHLQRSFLSTLPPLGEGAPQGRMRALPRTELETSESVERPSSALRAPSPNGGRMGHLEEYEISGHLHPGCAIAQRGRRVSGKCFVADQRRLIMPAFGAYTGALSVFSKPYERLFTREETHAWLIGQQRIYKFPFERLC